MENPSNGLVKLPLAAPCGGVDRRMSPYSNDLFQ